MPDSALQTIPFHADGETEKRGALPTVFLEINRGRTPFPYRPVLGRRFLIGSAPCCDLCLGSGAVPQLHSLLHVSAEEVVVEAVVEQPELKINGEIRQTAVLADGDRIEIGRFELVARISPPTAAGEQARAETAFAAAQEESPLTVFAPLESTVEAAEEAEIIDPGEGLEELSAEELVDLIEREEEEVRRFEERLQAGAEALLEAVANRAEEVGSGEEQIEAEDAEPDSAGESAEEQFEAVELVLERLRVVSDDRPGDGEDDRPAAESEYDCCRAAEELLQAHYRQTAELERLVVDLRAANAGSANDRGRHRAVA